MILGLCDITYRGPWGQWPASKVKNNHSNRMLAVADLISCLRAAVSGDVAQLPSLAWWTCPPMLATDQHHGSALFIIRGFVRCLDLGLQEPWEAIDRHLRLTFDVSLCCTVTGSHQSHSLQICPQIRPRLPPKDPHTLSLIHI